MADNKANPNFYSLGGVSVHEGRSAEYREYRRCWDEYPASFYLRDFPMHLDIEVTSRCNLKCTFCDKHTYLGRHELGDMEFSLFKKIIDEGAANKLWGVKLNHRGEPLLHREAVRMAAYAKSKGIIDVFFNTNGMLLSEEVSTKLIDAGLDRISVSIEGVDAVKFEKNRVGANFATILNNIKSLVALRKKKRSKTPKIRVQTVRLPGIDVDAYKNFWTELADEVAAIDFQDASKRETGLVRDWSCPQLWQRMTILWDGMVLPCHNNDGTHTISPGNAHDRTISSCWRDVAVMEMRELHRAGNSNKVATCDGCPWRTAQIKKADKGKI